MRQGWKNFPCNCEEKAAYSIERNSGNYREVCRKASLKEGSFFWAFINVTKCMFCPKKPPFFSKKVLTVHIMGVKIYKFANFTYL